MNEAVLAKLVAAKLCAKSPKQLVTVTETRWQPMRWSKKKWVKAGKLCATKPEGENYADTNEDTSKIWLCAKSRTVEVRQAVEITTLESAEQYVKDSCRDQLRQIRKLCRVLEREDCDAEGKSACAGEIAAILGLGVNIKTTGEGKDAQWFVYDYCKMPRQFKRERGRKTETLTTDAEALLTCYSKTKDERILHCLRLRSLLTQGISLRAGTDSDGRIRCGYNRVGTETDRLSCYESPTGSGFNLQTVTKKHRHLFQADDGCVMAQCDLKGSDGWTVACHAAALGDDTMLEDYRANLKPAKNIALIHLHGPSINSKSRDELREMHKTIDEDGWHYFTCKRGQHAGSYLVGEVTMSGQILSDSYKMSGEPVYVEPKLCRDILRNGFFVRYPGVLRWQEEAARLLVSGPGELRAPCGFKRVFYGRKKEKRATGWRVNHATLGEWLAHEPQVTTTNATVEAMLRCWSDPENRTEQGDLRVEPIHSVHDSFSIVHPVKAVYFIKRTARIYRSV